MWRCSSARWRYQFSELMRHFMYSRSSALERALRAAWARPFGLRAHSPGLRNTRSTANTAPSPVVRAAYQLLLDRAQTCGSEIEADANATKSGRRSKSARVGISYVKPAHQSRPAHPAGHPPPT